MARTAPRVSNVVNMTATQIGAGGDFTLAPQSPQITVQAGSSGTVQLNLQSLSNFNGAVALTCAPSSSQITCSFNSSTVTVNEQATASLTVNAGAKTSAVAAPMKPGSIRWPIALGVLFFGFVFAGRRTSRKFQRSLLLSLCLFALLLTTSCGGGEGSKTTPPPAIHGTYSVLVTGAANGIVHNAKITVVVP